MKGSLSLYIHRLNLVILHLAVTFFEIFVILKCTAPVSKLGCSDEIAKKGTGDTLGHSLRMDIRVAFHIFPFVAGVEWYKQLSFYLMGWKLAPYPRHSSLNKLKF